MHTIFLGREEVDAYLREFAQRLRTLDAEMPSVWCPIGASGKELAVLLAEHFGPAHGLVKTLTAFFDRDKDTVTFEDGDPAVDFKGERVLIIDSAVHGGTSMHRVVERVNSFEPQGVCTYSLVVKKGTRFVPSFWAVLVEDHDRVYFLLDEIPNQHLGRKNPYFHLRKLRQQDLGIAPVKSNLASLDRITWNDRYYEMVSSDGSLSTYLLEIGSSVVGYITLKLKAEKNLTVQEVAVDSSHTGKKLGHALMRWAETLARQSVCSTIDLWAIDNQLKFYGDQGFKQVQDRTITLADGETYYFMTKPILHHL